MQNNKIIFGDWILMEKSSNEVSQALLDHPYIDGYGECRIIGTIYDENYKRLDQNIGYFSSDFINRGNISLYNGVVPATDNEIAMDMDTLTKLGYSFDLGQTIDVYYIDKSTNASSNPDNNKKKKEYMLTGIFKSYRTLWSEGDNIPGLIVSEEAYNEYGFQDANEYIYTLKSNIETDDYSLVYKGLKERSHETTTYNKNLYNYKLWDSPSTYNLVLFLIMSLGIISITFQMVSYAEKRKPYYYKLRGIGASMNQIRTIVTIECLTGTLTAAVFGIILSVVMGWGICKLISLKDGITNFFIIDSRLLLRVMLLTFLLLVLSVIIVQILSGRRRVTENSFELTSKKLQFIKHMRLKRGNLTRQFISRRNNTRMIQTIFSRLFIIGICVILILCVNQIYKPYIAYQASLKIPDFDGILQNDIDKFVYIVDNVKETTDNNGNTKLTQNGGFSLIQCYMNGRTNAIIGFDDAFMSTLNHQNGIQSIQYYDMESTRSIIQNNTSGYNVFCQRLYNVKIKKKDGVNLNGGSNKQYYLYVSQYNTITQDQYNDFKKEIPDALFNYEDYQSGKQVILFLNSYDFGSGEEYDNEICPGDTLYYHYLFHTVNPNNLPYYNAIENIKIAHSQNIRLDEIGRQCLNLTFKLANEACLQPTVAAVIKLTPDNRQYYESLLPQQGYYTVLGSEQLGRNLVENEYKAINELVDNPDCTYMYNRIQIMLNLNSEYNGTSNMISQLFSKYGVSYTGHFEEKQEARRNLLDAELLYGTAFAAILIVFLLIRSNMHQAELDNQSRRFKLLKNLGADKKTIYFIIILGFLRENIWAFLAVAMAIYLLKMIVPITLCFMVSVIVFALLLVIQTIISLVYVNNMGK